MTLIIIGVRLVAGGLSAYAKKIDASKFRVVAWDFLEKIGELVKSGLRYLQKAIGSHGFGEISLFRADLERAFSGQFFFVLYIFLLAGSILGAVILVGANLEHLPGVEGTAIRAVFGYNLLFLATVLTATTIAVLLLYGLLRRIRMFRFRINLGSAGASLVSMVGIFTAAGVLAGALMPLGLLLRFSTQQAVTTSSLDPLTPLILVEIPAIMAAIGYVFGVLCFSFKIWGDVQNLLYRYILFPSVFLGILWFFLVCLDFNPKALFEGAVEPALVNVPLSKSDCDRLFSEGTLDAEAGNSAFVTSAFHRCGEGAFPPSHGIFVAIVVVVAVCAMGGFIRSLRQRNREQVRSSESEALVVAAHYQEEQALSRKYIITYELGDGTWEGCVEPADVVTEYHEGSAVTIDVQPIPPRGYTFVGWTLRSAPEAVPQMPLIIPTECKGDCKGG